MNKQVRNEILACLEQTYGDTKTALNYTTAFELLIAVILSAQCTDVRVNMITSRMFPRLNSAEKMLELGQTGLEQEIRDCGLFHSKAKNILATCQILCQKYHGEVPESFEKLLTLPGVGRKTANVMLSVAFGQPALAVDTHVFRVANRLKLATGDTPLAIEEGLKKIIPREKWGQAHHWLIWHGRKICKARKPLCTECPVSSLCPSSTVL
ncbi:endonuclease-3 [Sporomusaceae bacterium BoRhaA]|uniref:endonuclease III n=1 Tax=Pelorhabdus rhamnosifermentans TaxID=2772457 RepID=UPI001C0616F3|nr:endonuclease III [Pelorhabdus rhamnosifermentans]MBU2703445.1 endonuclease-3 [Pelorhabdus rhamnosifermentans]